MYTWTQKYGYKYSQILVHGGGMVRVDGSEEDGIEKLRVANEKVRP